MILVEIQYIDGCPNSEALLNRTREAIAKYRGEVDYNEVLVKTIEDAAARSFRGSPTLLINNQDIEGLPEVDSPGLTCRYYAKGLPSAEEILARFEEIEK